MRIVVEVRHSSIRLTADIYGHLEVGANRGATDRLPTLQTLQKQAAAQ